jgi:glycosyltransferase involved in cell wall biosynthesis
MDRLEYYPNWTNFDQFFYLPNFPSKSKFANLSLQNRFEKFTIIFQGHIGPGHGIEQFIKIVQKIKNVKLLLVGPIKEQYQIELEELAKKYNSFDNLEILGRIPYEQLIKLSSKCHLGIAIYDGNDEVSKTVGTASNKIYEYLACGMPIILSEKEQFIKTLGFESFYFYHNNEIEKLSQIIEVVKLDFKQLSEKARSTFMDKYTFESNFNKALNYLNAK